ncbi:MAG: CPBP family intramembrane metalloprotease [Clostridia bacterium]|nr:CPBP family intramembrane metalloprotease [Clostridia bacterium]
MLNKKQRSLSVVLLIYLICFVFRILEYFLLRTDKTFLGEAFVHKLIGIAVLFIIVKIYSLKLSEVGFRKQKVLPNLLIGLSFGTATFIFAYSVEILILRFQENFDLLKLYVSAYSVEENTGDQTAFIFFLICIIGNIINVIMEEGIFRGLFQKLLERKYAFITSAVLASVLFGIWHIISPLRSYLDGTISMGGFITTSIMLITTSALVGFKFAMMTKLTENLYVAMGDHFVNNTIVNMLHVISDTGTDELMVIRISIAQSVSFIAILLWYIVVQCKNKTESIR